MLVSTEVARCNRLLKSFVMAHTWGMFESVTLVRSGVVFNLNIWLDEPDASIVVTVSLNQTA